MLARLKECGPKTREIATLGLSRPLQRLTYTRISQWKAAAVRPNEYPGVRLRSIRLRFRPVAIDQIAQREQAEIWARPTEGSQGQ